MVALTLAISLLAVLLIVPGWLWRRRSSHQTAWLLALPFFGAGLWLALAALGIGPQSMGNFVEILVASVTAIVAAYLKLFVLDKFCMQKYGALAMYLAVGAIAVGLRLFMPLLPE